MRDRMKTVTEVGQASSLSHLVAATRLPPKFQGGGRTYIITI